MANTIHLEEKEGVAMVYLNRPEAYNAFDLDMVQRLAETLISLALDRDIAGVIISGKGKAFCAGGGSFMLPRLEKRPPVFEAPSGKEHPSDIG